MNNLHNITHRLARLSYHANHDRYDGRIADVRRLIKRVQEGVAVLEREAVKTERFRLRALYCLFSWHIAFSIAVLN